MNLRSRSFAESLEKLEPFYLHYHTAYGHQTWQVGSFSRCAPAHKMALLFDHMVCRDYVTNKSFYLQYSSGYVHETWQVDDVL